MESDTGALAVEVSDTQGHVQVEPGALAALARRVLAGEGVGRAAISVALVDDATIHNLNRRHLGHDWPTDVISFVLSEPGEPALAGELVVSAEMAATTARAAGADPAAELALYVVHGLLHLCGYDDRDEASAAAMRRREADVLAAAGLPNTFRIVEAAAEGRGGARCPA
ncbi:MAG TPA: rRNA maturation RNase YbeY [Isosphaeraceae bacterium]|jgi:probable rRNA maturation factor|nr:rRNA maturation RNase YbeY [Isosphaeraceae bacterium]